jgi:hypothetical protein
MTPQALFQLLERIGLLLAGVLGIAGFLWVALVYDRLPQSAPQRRLFPWSRRFRLWLLFVGVAFSVAAIVSAIRMTATTPSLLAVCSLPFWVACAIVWVQFMRSALRLATRLQERQDQADY